VHRYLIQQLDATVMEVFALMLNLACTSEPAGPAKGCGSPPSSGLTALVGFSGSLEGACTLQLNQCTAAELAANLMGIPRHEVPFELCADTAGELCNMIAGGWKARQPEHRALCQLSCPQVTVGSLEPPVLGFAQAITVLYYFAGHHLTLHLTCN